MLSTPNRWELAIPLDAARHYANQAYAPSTIRAYSSDWKDFISWAEERGVESFPASPDIISAYISDLAQGGHKISTIRRRLSSLHKAFDIAGTESPVKNSKVRIVVKGIARQHGSQQSRKEPLTTAMIKTWIHQLPENLESSRDKAVVLLGFAGALRRSEIVQLNIEDLEFVDEGLVLNIRRSKTDSEGVGEIVGIPNGRDENTCPVRATKRWIEMSEINAGPIFRGLWKGGEKIRSRAMSPRSVAGIVKKLCLVLGLNPTLYSGHSLRAGHATEAIRRGAEERAAMGQGRWKSRMVFRRYIREGNLFRENSASHLGL